MQLFNLTHTRQSLVEFVANKVSTNIQQSQLSVFDYLCQRYSVIIDEDLPDFIFSNTSNGCLVHMKRDDDELALEVLAHLLLFHHLIDDPSPNINDIFLHEVDLFLKCYHKTKDSCSH